MTSGSGRPHSTIWTRLIRGVQWSWCSESHRAILPAGLPDYAFGLQSKDRYHAKQGRATARVRIDAPSGGQCVSVYLKRHEASGWRAGLAALVRPWHGHSPAASEWRNLKRAQTLGIRVPETVAVGERIGPWGRLHGFLMVKELGGYDELNRVVPLRATRDCPSDFARWKRQVARELAEMVARLHRTRHFHKDLYLCHVFVTLDPESRESQQPTLIDLHRMARHNLTRVRWQVKDLAQLLYSTFSVTEINARDCLRFWMHYRRFAAVHHPRIMASWIRYKADRYLRHNQAEDEPTR